MPNEYAKAVRKLVQAKVEHRMPEINRADDSGKAPKVINIMAALKKSMQAKGRENVRDAVRNRMGKRSAEQFPPKTRTTSTAKKSTPCRVTH